MLRETLGLGMLFNTKAYQAGHEAGRAGLAGGVNPYIDGSTPWSDWNFGWRVAVHAASQSTNREVAQTIEAASPYDKGQAAASDGLGTSVNPYHHGNPAHEQWLHGWADRRRLV